jgi:hypothetical protein
MCSEKQSIRVRRPVWKGGFTIAKPIPSYIDNCHHWNRHLSSCRRDSREKPIDDSVMGKFIYKFIFMACALYK